MTDKLLVIVKVVPHVDYDEVSATAVYPGDEASTLSISGQSITVKVMTFAQFAKFYPGRSLPGLHQTLNWIQIFSRLV